MKFHYAGKYNGDESVLPRREHPEGYIPFKEPQNMKIFNIAITAVSCIILVILLFIVGIRMRASAIEIPADDNANLIGAVLALISLVPHEFLHAVWFRDDVHMYVNIKGMMMFVVGTEDMSKSRFIIMSLCPNIVFGAVPFIIFMIYPQWFVLGSIGAFALCMGAGDYFNVINAVIQMPKGALTYLNGFHSYWYIPEKD